MSQERLSPSEAHEYVRLVHLLEQNSQFVSDYLLLRASLSIEPIERRAWWLLYCLLRFVERRKQFPRWKSGELQSYFDSVLRRNKTTEDLLPPLGSFELKDLREKVGSLQASLRNYVSKK